MRKLKLFFACLLMAVLSIGQMWGALTNTYTKITSATSLDESAEYVIGNVEDYGCPTNTGGTAINTTEASWVHWSAKNVDGGFYLYNGNVYLKVANSNAWASGTSSDYSVLTTNNEGTLTGTDSNSDTRYLVKNSNNAYLRWYKSGQTKAYLYKVEAPGEDPGDNPGGGQEQSGDGYVLVENNNQIGAGDYLIVYNNTYALNTHSGNTNANTYGTYVDISEYYTSSTKTIASNSTTDALAYEVAGTTNGYSIKRKSATEYLGCTTATNSGLRWDTQFTASIDEWTLGVGAITSVEQTGRGIRWNNSANSYRFATYATDGQKAIQLFKKVSSAKVEKPTITGTDYFYASTEVSMSCSTEGATIYYTTNSTLGAGDPSTTTWTLYNASNKPSITKTTTFYAAAKKGDDWSNKATANLTKGTVISVGDALTAIAALDDNGTIEHQYVAGVVSRIKADSYNGTYKSITYWISADGTAENELQVYGGLAGVVKAEFASVNDIHIGDDVTVSGTLKKFKSGTTITPEFLQNNTIVAYKPIARLAWSGTTEGAFAASLEGGNTFPTLTNSDNVSVSYSSSETSYASFTDASDYSTLTLNAVGQTTITATFTGDASFKANSASYILNISSSVIKADISFEENGGSAVADLTAQSYLPSPLPTTTKEGKNFGGWYTKANFADGSEAVAGAAVESTDEIILYAKWLDPYTVTEALDIIDKLAVNTQTGNVYVAGVVTASERSFNSTHKSLTYFISVNGEAENELKIYSGKGLKDGDNPSGADFSSTDDLQHGDQVVVFGPLMKNQKNTNPVEPEMNYDNYIYSFTRPEVAVSGVTLDQNAASIEVDETVTLHETVNPDNASDKSITWTVESGDTYASVENGVVTGLAAGTAVIRAASTADPTKFAECTVTVTAADPTKHVVTFDATVDKGESPLSKSNITFTCSNGVLNNESEYRLYKSSTTTFACSVGNITKIEFTGVSGNPVSGFGDPEVGTLVTDGNNGVWTGNAASVSFVASGAQVRATEIKVTYKEDSRAEAGLAWDPAEDITLTVGDAFTAPTLLNPNSIDAAEITIESSNTAVATVTAGVVALVADATGEATITATFAGNDDYKPATVSYNITVNAAAPTPLTDYYEKVTSGDVAEGTYLIVYEAGNVAFNGGLETLDAVSNTIAVDITNENKIGVTPVTAAATFYIDPTAGTIKSASGRYIGRTANTNGLNASETEAYTNTISIDGDGNAVIVGSGSTATYLRYNPSQGQTRFRYFTQNQQMIALYKLANEVIKPASGLAWDPADDIELTVGDALSAPALLNPNSIPASDITIESSNTDVATVSEGVVSLVENGIGTTTISATYTGETYKPVTVSYKIKVNPASSIVVSPSLYVNFASVEKDASLPTDKTITVTLNNVATATATLAGDDVFDIDKTALVAGENTITISVTSTENAGEFSATITIADDATENPAAQKVVNLSFTVNDPVTPENPEVRKTWDLSIASYDDNPTEAQVTWSATYVNMVADKANSTTAANNYLGGDANNRTSSRFYKNSTLTITPNGKEITSVVFTATSESYANALLGSEWTNASASVDGTTVTVTPTDGKNAISATIGGTCGFTAVQVNYKDIEPEAPVYEDARTGLIPGNYYTICLPKKVTDFRGASVWNMNKRNAAETEVYLEEAALPFAAGTPFIIQATADKLEVVYEGDATETPVENGALRGTLTGFTIEQFDALTGNVYILKDNAIRPRMTGQNYLSANRAYILYNELVEVTETPLPAPGRRVVAMPMQGQTATGCENIQAAEAPVKMMIDGQLFILRGEKMYDTTGRLVK